jgi:hypothetical protein
MSYRNDLDAALARADSLESEVTRRDEEIERLNQMLAERGHGAGLGAETISPFKAISGNTTRSKYRDENGRDIGLEQSGATCRDSHGMLQWGKVC